MNQGLIVFDLDGTLADTLDGIMNSANHGLVQNGLSIRDRDFYVEAVGRGARVLIERALDSLGEDISKVDIVLHDFLNHYKDHWSYGLKVFEGIDVLLEKLREQGYTLAVNTNKPHSIALNVVDYLFDEGTFIDIKGAQEAYPKKPDTAGLDLIIETMNEPPRTCIYVGDSIVDRDTAANAKVTFVGVAWGFENVENFEGLNLVTTMDELLDAILSGSQDGVTG